MKPIFPVLLGAALLCSCAPSRESGRGGAPRGAQDPLGSFEADFRPSDHDTLAPPVTHAGPLLPSLNRDTTGSGALAAPDADGELVQGFRVQIFASTDIDQAKAKKLEAESDFPSEWFYLQYDPPVYKIRGGNFLQRYEAERFVRLAADKGFTDSWAVPEKVYKQPPAPSR